MKEPLWVAADDVRDFHGEQIAKYGGLNGEHTDKLLSTLERPKQRYFYGEKPDIFDIAASYGFGIAKNHPFADGNKRTASSVCITFLAGNGFLLIAGQNEIYESFLGVASDKINEEQLADWLRKNTVPIETL